MAAPGPGAGAIRGGSDGGEKVASGRLDAARLPSAVAAAGPAGSRLSPAVVQALARVPASRNRFPAEGAVAAPLPAWACACGLPFAGQAGAEPAAVCIVAPADPRHVPFGVGSVLAPLAVCRRRAHNRLGHIPATTSTWLRRALSTRCLRLRKRGGWCGAWHAVPRRTTGVG